MTSFKTIYGHSGMPVGSTNGHGLHTGNTGWQTFLMYLNWCVSLIPVKQGTLRQRPVYDH